MVWEPLPVDSSRRAPRSPAALLLSAAVVGIVADRWNAPPTLVWWLILSGGIVAALLIRWQRDLQLLALCTAWASLFGLWHHAWWADPPATQVYHWATDAGRLVRLVGRVAEPGWTRQRIGSDPETIVLFRAEGVIDDARRVTSTSGLLRIQIDAPNYVAWAGDRWEVTGRLIRPATAGNPGGFDYRQWLRTQGVQSVLQVQQELAITRLAPEPGIGDELINWRQRLRQHATHALQESLDGRTAAVAEALLLGTRSQLPEDLRTGLMHCGLLHVLAISGLNVAVIWLGLMRLCRLMGIALRTSHVLVITGLIGYAWLTDANPPIVRAVTFACVWQLAELSGRRVSALQAMSLAALVVISRNPTDVFNPAAWLSFLSVTVLASVNRRFDRSLQTTDDTEPGADGVTASGWKRWLPREVWRLNLSTAAVWCVTAPLVASRYHLVSFAGWGLNVLLSPLILLMMWLGYVWLLLLAIAPPVSDLALWPFAGLLQVLLWVTQQVGRWESGYGYFVGPPAWWLLGLYGGALLGTLRRDLWSWGQCCRWFSVWMNVGLAWGLLPTTPPGLTCDVVAVGHGLAIVMHSPEGRTLVYDAGSLAGPSIATEAVSQALWSAGQTRIDALVLSHADADHCNGVPGLAERFHCGVLLTHPTFEQNSRPTVQQVLQAWRSHGGLQSEIARGDRILWDPDVSLSVLHPRNDVAYARDNANSLVILVEYAGRRILLTGDLEQEGLVALLQHPREAVDVVISPHHGSRAANTPEFGAWTNPIAVAVSASNPEIQAGLVDRYPPEAGLWNTAQSGRIRCHISPLGELTVEPFRSATQ